MNEHTPRPRREPTQAAEGHPRWRWTLAEFDRFIELGIITDDDRVELIGGELVPMAAKGIAHEDVKVRLAEWIGTNLPRSARLATELGWRPDGQTYCEPDLLAFPRSVRTFSKVPPSEVLLLVEVADTTLKSDLTIKAALYARLGVREYWVVNAFTRDTHVHREPTAGGYRRKRKVAADKLLTASLVSEISLRLHDLGDDGE